MDRFSYNGNGDVAVNPDDPKPSHAPADNSGTGENTELEDFFQRLPANFRWPKPTADAVAAAVEAIQRMSGGAVPENATPSSDAEPGENCAGCGRSLPVAARFCVWCGQAKNATGAEPMNTPQPRPGEQAQHHYHHHYHHLVPAQERAAAAPSAEQESPVPRGKATASTCRRALGNCRSPGCPGLGPGL